MIEKMDVNDKPPAVNGRRRVRRGWPRPMTVMGFFFWFSALSFSASFSLLLAFEFDEPGRRFYGGLYAIILAALLAFAVHNIYRSPAKTGGFKLLILLIVSILANALPISLSIWICPVGPDQPYIIRMQPDDVRLFLICIGQIVLEIAAGTATLFASMARSPRIGTEQGDAGGRVAPPDAKAAPSNSGGTDAPAAIDRPGPPA